MDTSPNPVRMYRDVSEPALGDEQYKLDRLFELRAVIDSLRSERGGEPHCDGNDDGNRVPAL